MRSTPNRRLYSQNKKKTKNKPYSKKFFLTVLILLILAVLIWRIFFYVPKYEVTLEEWYFESEVDGKLLYESTPLVANNKGVLHIQVDNNTVVSENEDMFSIVDSEKEETLRTRIDETENQLENFDLSEIDESKEEIVNENTPLSDLRNMVRLYGFYQSEFKASGISNTYKSILELEKEYFDYINQVKNDRMRYQSLQKELSNLKKEYEECSELTVSPTDGVILYQYDNLDEKITIDNIVSIYAQMLETNIEKEIINDGDNIEVGEQVGIVVNDKTFYLALIIPEDLSYYLNLADTIEVSFDDEIINYEVVEEELDNTHCLLRTTDKLNPKDKDIKLTINTEKLEGFYVPKESIIAEEENLFVYVYDGRHPIKTPIEILKDEGDKLFIKGLKDGDKIVENIEEFRR